MSVSISNNRIVVDLKKVQFANFYWRNQYNQIAHGPKPTTPSIRCVPYKDDDKIFGTDKNLIDVAKERGYLDVWTAEVYLRLSTKSDLTFTGAKAFSIWKIWKARVFNGD